MSLISGKSIVTVYTSDAVLAVFRYTDQAFLSAVAQHLAMATEKTTSTRLSTPADVKWVRVPNNRQRTIEIIEAVKAKVESNDTAKTEDSRSVVQRIAGLVKGKASPEAEPPVANPSQVATRKIEWHETNLELPEAIDILRASSWSDIRQLRLKRMDESDRRVILHLARLVRSQK